MMEPEKKKIAFFVNSFPVISETFILNQIIALQKEGHHVDIFALHQPHDNKIHDAVASNQLMQHVTYLDALPLSRISKMNIFFAKLIRNINVKNLTLFFYYINYVITFKKRYVSFYNVIHFLDKPCYDFVHAHYGFSGKAVVDLMSIGLLRRAKLVTTFHGYDFRVEEGYYDKLFQKAEVFTVNTNYSKQKLTTLGCPENKIRILPVGFDTELFLQQRNIHNESSRPFTIIYIGRLYAIKAPDFFIEICEWLKKKHNLHYNAWVIGDGDMKQQLESIVTEKDLSENVKLLGSRTQKEIQVYLSQSDVFVLTGRTVDGYAETQGLVVQEAQAMGLPVVVSDIGGIAEGILRDETGFAIQGENAEAFAAKLLWLYQHPDERKKMGQHAREFVAHRYTSEMLNKRLTAIYEEII